MFETIKIHYGKLFTLLQFILGIIVFFLLYSGIAISCYFAAGVETVYRETLTSDIVVCDMSLDTSNAFYWYSSGYPMKRLEDPGAIERNLLALDSIESSTRISTSRIAVIGDDRSSAEFPVIFIDPDTYYKVFSSCTTADGDRLSVDAEGIAIPRSAVDKIRGYTATMPVPYDRINVADPSLTLASMRETIVREIYSSPAEPFFSDTIFSNSKALTGEQQIADQPDRATDVSRCFEEASVFGETVIEPDATIGFEVPDDSFYYDIVPPHADPPLPTAPATHMICIRANPDSNIENLAIRINAMFGNSGLNAKAISWRKAAAHDLEKIATPLVIVALFTLLFIVALAYVSYACHANAIDRTWILGGKIPFPRRSVESTFIDALKRIIIIGVLCGCAGILLSISASELLVLAQPGFKAVDNKIAQFVLIGIVNSEIPVQPAIVTAIFVFVTIVAETFCIRSATLLRMAGRLEKEQIE